MLSINWLLRCSILFYLIIIFSSLVFADNNDSDNPKISVTILVVPEKEACKPNGYQRYESGLPSKCEKLLIKDIEKWQDRINFSVKKIPPSKISLGSRLFGILDAYRTTWTDDPEKRKAVVLVFDWGEAQNISLELERDVLFDNVPIKDLKWSGKLAGEQRWIHHERADAFLPAYGIKWTLNAGGYTWILKTER